MEHRGFPRLRDCSSVAPGTQRRSGAASAMSGNPFWDAWYFHLPNFVLAALMYSLIGRLLLQLVAPPDWDNYILKAFRRLTDPVLHAVAFVTPAVIPDGLVVLLAAFWVLLLRILLFLVFALSGLQPPTGLG